MFSKLYRSKEIEDSLSPWYIRHQHNFVAPVSYASYTYSSAVCTSIHGYTMHLSPALYCKAIKFSSIKASTRNKHSILMVAICLLMQRTNHQNAIIWGQTE